MSKISGAKSSEISSALRSCRSALLWTGVFSGVSNVLMLTGAIFMLEVYDRVLPSRSIQTLVGLAVLAAGLYAALGVMDFVRTRVLVRIGMRFDEIVGGRIYESLIQLPAKAGQRAEGLQSLRDLDSVRTFLSGLGPIAFFDLPWIPLYLAICFAFHTLIGVAALIGAIILCIVTVLTEVYTREPSKKTAEFARLRSKLAKSSRRNAETVVAMGMSGRLTQKWTEINGSFLNSQRETSDLAGGFTSSSKVLRMVLQSAVLAVGAYLVIEQQATAGVIIASSILSGRALAPVDLAIANWKSFVAARQSWSRLDQLLTLFPASPPVLGLEPPRETLEVDAATIIPPGTQKPTVLDIRFKLKAGDGLAIIGPSGSGKSCLARALVGVWQPARGAVRLDAATYDQWSPDVLGTHIGYVPQDVELFEGTLAQNIARFNDQADPTSIIAAAKAAGVHELILSLPQGYDTPVGEQGTALSAGQAQRIALARALYGEPFLVVLDEPNSNLDSEGDEALTAAIEGIRARGGIVIVVAHRPSAIIGLDLVLLMNNGRQVEFGPKESILAQFIKRTAPTPGLTVVPEMTAATA